MPGTWLAHVELAGDLRPVVPVVRCRSSQPLIWDGKCGYWRHLADGMACGGVAEFGIDEFGIDEFGIDEFGIDEIRVDETREGAQG